MELPPTDFESAEVVQSHTLSGHKIDENGQRSKNARSRATPLQSTWPYSPLSGQVALGSRYAVCSRRSEDDSARKGFSAYHLGFPVKESRREGRPAQTNGNTAQSPQNCKYCSFRLLGTDQKCGYYSQALLQHVALQA